MGKLMTRILKGKAKKLKDMYPNDFDENFEHNKETLTKLGFFDYSKTDRNLVAGQIARIKTEEAKEE